MSLSKAYNIDQTINELERYNNSHLSQWRNSPWLKGSLGIIFDKNNEFILNGFKLLYDEKYGVTIEGWIRMSRFNLLDEPWISVVYDGKGSTKDVSLQDLFTNAHQYKELAGDTKTQDFAVLRVLLAVLHTVLSDLM